MAEPRIVDAYRIFFPLGILLGIIAVIVWPLSYFGVLPGYWGLSHIYLQSDGFLLCFIAGFLLTAVPSFTGTAKPGIASHVALAAMIVIGSVLLMVQQYAWSQILFAAAYLFFAVQALRRMQKRDRPLPVTFSLVGIGIFTGLIGTVINALAVWGMTSTGWALAGKRSLTEGMTLLLVLGVGGFLGPRLLGFDRLNFVQIQGIAPKRRWIERWQRPIYLVSGVLIVLTIVLEYAYDVHGMSLLRAAVATFVMAATIEPWKLPLHRTTLAWCAWVSNLLTIIALWLLPFWPQYRTDFLHVLFIGGFTLIILAVGLRVALSHGGYGVEAEVKSWPLRIALVSGVLAMCARVSAPFLPASYSAHLAYAGLLWLIGFGIWGWKIFRLASGKKQIARTPSVQGA